MNTLSAVVAQDESSIFQNINIDKATLTDHEISCVSNNKNINFFLSFKFQVLNLLYLKLLFSFHINDKEPLRGYIWQLPGMKWRIRPLNQWLQFSSVWINGVNSEALIPKGANSKGPIVRGKKELVPSYVLGGAYYMLNCSRYLGHC